MMRSLLISLSKASWAQRLVTRSRFGQRISRRFVAGVSIEDAIRVVRELNAKGIRVTLDPLGENTLDAGQAEQAAGEIIHLLEEIQTAEAQANVSIKLSQVGLRLAEPLCQKNLARILDRARELGNFIRIDMEDSSLTDATLSVFEHMLDLGYDNVGVVLQAYLYRTEGDLERILARRGRVRLCKGAYLESSDVAFPQKTDVDANYDHLARILLNAMKDPNAPSASLDGRFPPVPALATHDLQRIQQACAYAEAAGLSRSAFEFQMLYGIRRDLQEGLSADGYRVRVYVPYGEHWYPYLMRRLAERPANVWFVLKNLFAGQRGYSRPEAHEPRSD
jgi:proline dehydrogenase